MAMILSIIKILPAAGKQREILEILLSVRGPTVAVCGCLECSIYEEQDDDGTIVYMERWQSSTEMISHILSPVYSRLLKALELSAREPEVRFYEIAGTKGMELIEDVRPP